MAAITSGRPPVRAAKLNVELLESRDVASATVGYVAEYHEGVSWSDDGTGMGWATGSYTVVTSPQAEAPVAAESPKTGVYLDGDLVAEVDGEPALAFFAPPVNGKVIPGGETIVYVNGQPVGTVRGEPSVEVARREADGGEQDSGPAYFVTGTGEPDEESFDLALAEGAN